LIEPHKDGTLIRMQVQPKSSRNAIKIESDGPLRVYVTAPPSDGAANKAVIQLLAKRLSVPRRTVKIISGLASRKKGVLIEGMNSADAETILVEQQH
jgi:uncharacterized protein